MKIRNFFKGKQILWHMMLCLIVFLLIMPIVFAMSNSLKTVQDAFNSVFEVIPRNPTIENYVYYNNAIESAFIPYTKHLPHMEAPEKIINYIHTFLL